ncbi:MAG: ATP-binding cassette domain-containing protein [Deltaproteobacteria bacterium]|nr:ATP-binding cassette domain-containing protein [Deltaproteobacteria bacterium]
MNSVKSVGSSRKFVGDESQFKGRYSPQVLQTVFKAYRPFRGKIIALIFLGFFGRLLMLGNANLVSWWADPKSRPDFLASMTADGFIETLAWVTVAGFLLTSLYRVAFSRLSAQAISRLYDEVTLRTSRLDMSFFDTQPVGRIVTRFSSDYGNVFRLFGGPLAEFFAIIFDLLAMAILIAVANPYFLILFLFVAALQGLVYKLNQRTLRRERRALSGSRSPSIAHFAESAQGATSIRIFDRLTEFSNRFESLNREYLMRRMRTSKYLIFFSLQMGGLTALLLLATGVLGWWLVQIGEASIASVGVAFAFIMLSANSVQMFFEWMAQFEEAMTGVERLDEYLRRDLERGMKLPASARFDLGQPKYTAEEELKVQREKLTLRRAASVSIQGLKFRYAPDLPLVLNDVSFEIKAGEKVGIVGRTGSGKSSLIQALFRLYPVDQGEIRIEGQQASVPNRTISKESSAINGIDLGVYRRSIAYIAQEPTLFRGTLRENLDLNGVHSDTLLIEALDRVELDGWFRSLPHGLASHIEEKGKNLSAGERQLLCMARCLLQDAPVVVMDEATSAIDPQTEEVLVKATEEFFADRTQVIIAHRLSTLIDCDRVLWLKSGTVKMFDRPEVVLPLFREAELREHSEA